MCTAELGFDDMHHSEVPSGEAAHNVTPKKHVEYALHQPRNFVRLSQVFPRVTQVGGALAHDNLDDDESIRMACATAAAVNGAIAEGAIFEAAKGKEGITEVLKSAVVDPPVGGKRTRMATRALHRGEDDGKRPKTCGVGNGARHRTDNSSGSMTSRPLTGGESNGLADIHNLQVDVLASPGTQANGEHNGKPRSSQYRGVTKHKRSGRWEAHIWVKETGKQVYLGGYEKEEHAAEAYDVAAMKCKGGKAGRKVKLNFPATKYSELNGFMESVSLEELVMAIRRQSQGFARGSSGFRGVTHHPNGRWEARIGMPGSKHIYLGLYNEEAAAARAYDRALVRLRGASAATNYSLTNYQSELQAFEMYKSTEKLALSSSAKVLCLPAPPKSAKMQTEIKSEAK